MVRDLLVLWLFWIIVSESVLLVRGFIVSFETRLGSTFSQDVPQDSTRGNMNSENTYIPIVCWELMGMKVTSFLP